MGRWVDEGSRPCSVQSRSSQFKGASLWQSRVFRRCWQSVNDAAAAYASDVLGQDTDHRRAVPRCYAETWTECTGSLRLTNNVARVMKVTMNERFR